jgi:hypothetical protein
MGMAKTIGNVFSRHSLFFAAQKDFRFQLKSRHSGYFYTILLSEAQPKNALINPPPTPNL